MDYMMFVGKRFEEIVNARWLLEGQGRDVWSLELRDSGRSSFMEVGRLSASPPLSLQAPTAWLRSTSESCGCYKYYVHALAHSGRS